MSSTSFMLTMMPSGTHSAAPVALPTASVLQVRVSRGYGPGLCLFDVYRLAGPAYGCQVCALALDEPGHDERLRLTPGSLSYDAPGNSLRVEVPPTTLPGVRARLGWPAIVFEPAERLQKARAHLPNPELAAAGWAVLEDDADDVLQLWPTLDAPARLTVVMLAAAVGAQSVVQWLLCTWPHAVAQREPAPSGNTPLHYAALGGHKGCVESLLAAGACATQKNEVDAEPKHEAARNAHAPVLQRLLQLSPMEGQDKFGDTILLRLALFGAHQPDQAIESYRVIYAARQRSRPTTHWYSYANRENRSGLSALDLAKLTGQDRLARALEADGAYHSALFRMAPAYSLSQRFIFHGAQARHLLEPLDGKRHGLRAGHASYLD